MSGKPITSKPVYGYLMDEDENFIIDEEDAPVVKQIYNLCLAGNGPTKIARMLTEQQIRMEPPPTQIMAFLPVKDFRASSAPLPWYRSRGRVKRAI